MLGGAKFGRNFFSGRDPLIIFYRNGTKFVSRPDSRSLREAGYIHGLWDRAVLDVMEKSSDKLKQPHIYLIF